MYSGMPKKIHNYHNKLGNLIHFFKLGFINTHTHKDLKTCHQHDTFPR